LKLINYYWRNSMSSLQAKWTKKKQMTLEFLQNSLKSDFMTSKDLSSWNFSIWPSGVNIWPHQRYFLCRWFIQKRIRLFWPNLVFSLFRSISRCVFKIKSISQKLWPDLVTRGQRSNFLNFLKLGKNTLHYMLTNV